jgi:prophage tail gpP-like protein
MRHIDGRERLIEGEERNEDSKIMELRLVQTTDERTHLIPTNNKRSESTTSESTKTKTTTIGQNALHFMHLTCHSTLITLHRFNIILSTHMFAKALWQVKNELHIKDTIFLNRGSATVFS